MGWRRRTRRQEGAWHSCFLLSPSVIGNEAVMSYLALEAPGWLKIHAAQAPNDHSGLHLSVAEEERVHMCACVCVWVCRYVIQACRNFTPTLPIPKQTRHHPPPHKITAQVFRYWSLIRRVRFRLITNCSSEAQRSAPDQTVPVLWRRLSIACISVRPSAAC